MARMGAETLTIPKAEGGAALDRLLELAERYGMDVETVTEETHLPFGNGELTIFPPLGVSGSNELGSLCWLRRGSMTSSSPATWSGPRKRS